MKDRTSKNALNRREILAGTSSLLLAGTAGSAFPLRAVAEDCDCPTRKKISIGILGQSNEQNRVQPEEAATIPAAFVSKYNPAVRAPQQGNIVLKAVGGSVKSMAAPGGMWFVLYDRLWELGYDAAMVNGAIGSASMIRDFAGSSSPWRPANSEYFKQRASIAPEDNGDAGSFIVAGEPARIFRCIEGRQRFAVLDGNAFLPGTSIDKVDYIAKVGKHKSGSQPPDWNSVSKIGDTLIDGDLIWRYEADNTIGLHPAETGRGGCHQIMGRGFWDPLGLIARLTNMMMTIHHVEDRWIILQNGQSDYGGSATSQSAYKQALENITQYFLDRGFKVAIGLSCYTPTQDQGSWEGLDNARKSALATFAGNTRVEYGANLYNSLGTDVASLLQKDGVHLNGKGAVAAGKAWGEAFENILK